MMHLPWRRLGALCGDLRPSVSHPRGGGGVQADNSWRKQHKTPPHLLPAPPPPTPQPCHSLL
ncbi:hypothetical protein E2C01_046048 [Portunus trituberculatus]|uniref:Uncharacterized protein n=1 Tax=Portunus trituberculatus TaxID=210409 RepID=A0A5B7G376_PORTR|nr:hypothetical protein [Portunus trituberculatus]